MSRVPGRSGSSPMPNRRDRHPAVPPDRICSRCTRPGRSGRSCRVRRAVRLTPNRCREARSIWPRRDGPATPTARLRCRSPHRAPHPLRTRGAAMSRCPQSGSGGRSPAPTGTDRARTRCLRPSRPAADPAA
ncbi:hypothetical protein G155_10570 [Mycobacterium sp. VKM Ac-1817D]|nr:hypothetical protein G155_10570 [Mycobacterium sp. VKM Ac-1817D]